MGDRAELGPGAEVAEPKQRASGTWKEKANLKGVRSGMARECLSGPTRSCGLLARCRCCDAA